MFQFRIRSSFHLWYLTKELVVFALFDTEDSNQERKLMAEKLLSFPRPLDFEPGKPYFPDISDDPALHQFIGQKSWLLFHFVHTEGRWLNNDIDTWKGNKEYESMRNLLYDLKVVNDLVERCVKDVEEYANVSKDAEHSDNVLLVATDHRGVFQDLRKASLR